MSARKYSQVSADSPRTTPRHGSFVSEVTEISDSELRRPLSVQTPSWEMTQLDDETAGSPSKIALVSNPTSPTTPIQYFSFGGQHVTTTSAGEDEISEVQLPPPVQRLSEQDRQRILSDGDMSLAVRSPVDSFHSTEEFLIRSYNKKDNLATIDPKELPPDTFVTEEEWLCRMLNAFSATLPETLKRIGWFLGWTIALGIFFGLCATVMTVFKVYLVHGWWAAWPFQSATPRIVPAMYGITTFVDFTITSVR
jgi:hypothetical protein